MAHSPAPWIVSVDSDDWSSLLDANGNPIISTVWYPSIRDVEQIWPKPEDAALICAAPELLEACKMALDVISELGHIYSDRQKEAEQKLLAAIAKATNPIQANQSDADILSRQIVAEEYHCGKCGRLLTNGESHNCTNPIQTT